MTVSFVSSATSASINTTATNTMHTANVPAMAAGDVAVLQVITWSNASAPNVPAGWSLVKRTTVVNSGVLSVFTKTAAAPAGATTVNLTTSTAELWATVCSVWRDAVVGVSAAWSSLASDTVITVPSITPAQDGLWLAIVGDAASAPALAAPPGGWTYRNGAMVSGRIATGLSQKSVPGGVATGDASFATTFVTNSRYAVSLALHSTNNPPAAPILTAPADGATIDRNSVQRFSLTPSDPDPGDTTSQTWWRYRLIGAPAWTTVTQTSPLTYIDFAAGTFAAGDYEWQAATRDAQGAPTNDADLKWSTSSFFTAATAPAAPTITAPINGATVTSAADVTWSTPSQGSYQLRRVKDNAGAADATTVYYDTGEVVTTTARSRSVAFETNNRYEHVQVRIKVGGLWSSWASVRVNVSFTPPTVPVVTLTPDAATGSLLVGITNPAPGAGVPATSYNDVYVDDGDGEERRATMLAPNATWTYWTPKSGRDYDGKVRVVAVGSNGTTASS